MTEIRRVVRKAGWRLLAIDFLRVLAVVLTAALGGIIITRIVERLFALSGTIDPLWPRIFLFTGAGVLAVSGLIAVLRRRRTLAVARELDERAGLKEALSTALYVERVDDPWCRAVVQDARGVAAKVKVGLAIPMEAPRLWPAPVLTGLALVLAWYAIPASWDPFGHNAKKTAEVRKVQEVQAVKADIQTKQDKLKELLAKAKGPEFVEDQTQNADEKKAEMQDPDALRRAAVKKLTDIAEKLEAQKEGEKAAQIEAVKEAMRQLKQPGQGPLNEFTRQLARGDFNKAQEQLNELAKQLAGDNLSPEAKEQARQQMENLSKQLDKLAKDKEALAKKMEQQGLDKQTAKELAQKAASGDPDKIKEALEKAQNLTEEQKKQLMEMAKSAMKSQEMSQQMAEGLSKMAQGMTQQGLQQEGMEGMSELSGALSEAEVMESDMQNLDAALDEAKKQLSQLAGECMGGDCNGDGDGKGKGGMGRFREGDSRKFGNGTGGPGHGNGASPESSPVDYKVDKSKANVKSQGGPIIGSRLVYGEQVKGESKAEFAAVVEAGQQEAAEAIDGMLIPREYHDSVKHYFGNLEKKVKDQPPAPAPAPEKKGN
jgi:hypothetical protein